MSRVLEKGLAGQLVSTGLYTYDGSPFWQLLARESCAFSIQTWNEHVTWLGRAGDVDVGAGVGGGLGANSQRLLEERPGT